MAISSETDAAEVYEVVKGLETWIEHLLELERTVSPTILPPGIGILYAMDDVLDPESEAVSAYLRLLDRLEVLKGPLEKELSFRRLFDGWGPSIE